MLTSIAAASHAIAALAFLFLSALLLRSWRGHPNGMALALACLLTATWAASVVAYAVFGRAAAVLPEALEILRSAGWLAFLLKMPEQLRTPPQDRRRESRLPLLAVIAVHLALLAMTLYLHFLPGHLPGSAAFMATVMTRLAIALFGLVLVEQLYRGSTPEARWAIKYACLGMGCLYAYDFYLYSDAILFRRASTEIWSARGLVDALTVPLIAVSAARNPRWSPGIAVSRTMLLRSVTLFGAAAYLLAMAAAGYAIRLSGGAWGSAMELAFLFGAAALLLALLFSGSVRARAKVFINKHFYSYDYDYRKEWQQFTRALSDEGPGLAERSIQAVANLMESPAGLLFVCRDDTGSCEPAARWNMRCDGATESLQGSLCRFLEERQWVIDVNEYKASPEKYGRLILPPWLLATPQAWLVVPLLLGRRLFGFIVLAEARSPVPLDWEATDLLKLAGAQAATCLAQHEAASALMVARQFESYTRMSTFIVHDLKNLVSQLTLLLDNAKRHRDNPEFQEDMLHTIDSSVQRMKRLLQKLGRESSREQREPVRLDELLQEAVAAKSACRPCPVLATERHSLTVIADHARLERVIGHLIQNAVEATPKDGRVVVRLTQHADYAVIEVQDSGHGMTEEFIRERLFKPFESTKPAGMGIGVFESQAYIRELGGQIEVQSRPSAGTTFRVSLPLCTEDAPAKKRAALTAEH
ncbi:XrtA/PEP-CTERM system histidine kinase PrsK [Noviherbaspirillum massiliense]|uniref:XrtA/PEP-CTERM system histidine kinase PrsK n=1 Tax=Noviherbaspirillum massiliense TaxID=1465823 RepID=UPI000300087C|nr:XrtA/PEP-CTERM system histidine kinase PrsK [Noviherbaspirillum massiliense]